jgi:hypothetical protein
MEDRLPGDLDFAGNAGKGVFGAQATHRGPRGGTVNARHADRPKGVLIDRTNAA